VYSPSEANPAWSSEPVTIAGFHSYISKVLDLDGKPAVFSGMGQPAFSRALDTAGTQWAPFTVVESVGYAPSYLPFICNGRPSLLALSQAGALLYCPSADARGAVWGSPRSIPGASAVSFSLAAQDLAGCPACVYQDPDGRDLRYVAALDSGGNAWSEPEVVDSAGSTGESVALLLLDGKPAVAYSASTRHLDGSWSYEIRLARRP
jgi:hypothetical protein